MYVQVFENWDVGTTAMKDMNSLVVTNPGKIL
jgi:hypothetical protein